MTYITTFQKILYTEEKVICNGEVPLNHKMFLYIIWLIKYDDDYSFIN